MPGAAIGAVATVAGGALSASASSKASKRAADAQAQASAEATALQREIYNDQRQLLQPTSKAGALAYARQMVMQGIPREQVIQYLRDTDAAFASNSTATGAAPVTQTAPPGRSVGGRFFASEGGVEPQGNTATPTTTAPQDDSQYDWLFADYQSSSPSYNFRFNQGQKALERSKAASGDYFSGDTAQALTRYGQDFASQEFEADFNRYGALSGTGQANTGRIVDAAGNYGQQAGANIIRAGDARATGYANSGAAWSNFYGGLGGYIGGLANKWG